MHYAVLQSLKRFLRQLEMLNIFAGFEQSNKYVICEGSIYTMMPPISILLTQYAANENEEVLGYIAEEPRGMLAMFARQLFRTHRPFRALVMDSAGSPILWVGQTCV